MSYFKLGNWLQEFSSQKHNNSNIWLINIICVIYLIHKLKKIYVSTNSSLVSEAPFYGNLTIRAVITNGRHLKSWYSSNPSSLYLKWLNWLLLRISLINIRFLFFLQLLAIFDSAQLRNWFINVETLTANKYTDLYIRKRRYCSIQLSLYFKILSPEVYDFVHSLSHFLSWFCRRNLWVVDCVGVKFPSCDWGGEPFSV